MESKPPAGAAKPPAAPGENADGRSAPDSPPGADGDHATESRHGSAEPPGADVRAGTDNARRFATMYSELRRLAERQLRRNSAASISPTTLLHEAYLGMSARDVVFPDRERFMGYAARVMRGLIIDFVRERRALKRGSEFHITRLPTGADAAPIDDESLLRVSEALDELASRDPRLAEVVDLKYFCGYTFEEIAALRGSSPRTVQRDWEKARLILFQQLKQGSAL